MNQLVLVDACLTPSWCEYLISQRIPSQHWSTLGALNASDTEIKCERNIRFRSTIGDIVVATIREYSELLERGAPITIEPDRLRARVLPAAIATECGW